MLVGNSNPPKSGLRGTLMPMAKDINCLNFKSLLAYIRKHYGAEGVRRITADLVGSERYLIQDIHNPSRQYPIEQQQLSDPAYWVSNEFSLALFANVRKLVGGQNPLFTAGAGAVRENLSNSALFAGRIFGPRFLAGQAARLNARLNRTKDVELIELKNNKASLKLCYRPGFRVTRDVCEWNLGIYTELTKLSGVTRVRSEETQCVLTGADCCIFKLTWRKTGPIKRLLTGLLAWLVRWDIRDVLEEYESTTLERDRLIEELSTSERKYRTLFEDSMDAMCLTHQGKIADVNPAWLKMHGYGRKEAVVGTDVIQLIHPEDRVVLNRRRLSWPRLKTRVYQLRDLRKDGQVIDVELYSSGITIDGRDYILATIRDITAVKQNMEARRKLEIQLQRAQKMEAIGTLAGGVAHDLNNILSGIVSYPDLLLMQIPQDSPLREPLETMQATGKKAAAIVQDLLTLARRGVAVTEIVNLNRIVSDYLESPEFKKFISYHPDVEIETRLNPNLLNIVGSPVHLSKTVMNLVSNAAEAMPSGGRITIATDNRYIDQPFGGYDEVAEGDYAVLQVDDNGIGMSTEDKERIFEPFYTKKKMGKSGTGLGMAVVWGTVKDHQGYIDLRSAENQGTVFILYFPVTRKELTAGKVKSTLSDLAGKGETVLIIDDVREQREIAGRMLEALGYAVRAVASGEEALVYLQDHRVDLLVLDMIMAPGIDGLETYRQIAARYPGQKAVIASGFSENRRVKEAQQLGAGQYVKKPYTLEKIGLAVKQELNRP